MTLGIKKTRPNGISARIVKKRSEANGRQKVLRRVNFGIEQGGRQKFMLRWRFQVKFNTGVELKLYFLEEGFLPGLSLDQKD